MSNSELFNKELSYIQSTSLRNFVSNCLDDLPDYSRHIGTSTSGKYHPAYTLGEGGLVRHTKAAIGIAKELIRADLPFFGIQNSIDADVIYSSLLLHDGLKCGMWEDKTAFDHPLLIKDFVRKKSLGADIPKEVIDRICKCIASHMGRWNTHPDYPFELPTPKTGDEQLVHLCDYLASRKNLEFRFDAEGSVDDSLGGVNR